MSKPFSDLTFCFTGLESSERTELAAKIATLGGDSHMDLMSTVNFLIVGGRRTEKYKYCVRFRHDIHFLAPITVHELHSRWKKGENVTANDVNKHHLGLFANFTVCVARVEDPGAEERTRYMAPEFRSPPEYARPSVIPDDVFQAEDLIHTMVKGGANVSSILTPACTVLVGSDCSGKRYTMAREWGVPVVHPIWVLDSCLRGAALDPDDYELSASSNYYVLDTLSWDKLYAARAARTELLPLRDRSGPRERSALLRDRERSSLKKSSEVWSSIMETRVEPIKQVQNSTWDMDEGSGSQEKGAQDHMPGHTVPARDNHTNQSTDSALFASLTFLPLGLSSAQKNVLRKVVESHSGEMAKSAEDSRISHIVSLVKNGSRVYTMLQELPTPLHRRVNNHTVHIVTDWFIERSVYYNKVCYDSWSKPLHGVVPSLSRLKVCVTGFTGVELLHIEKLITLLNLECCSVLSARRDLLVLNINLFKNSLSKTSPHLFEYKPEDVIDCPVYNSGHESKSIATISAKNKIKAAKKWGIPIVSLAYLWEMVETSRGMPNLNIPDVADRRWCFYAPQESGTAPPESKSAPAPKDGVQLPSPRKSKEKHKYGRLVGGGESLTKKLNMARTDTTENSYLSDKLPDQLDSDNDSTQVGYGNVESIRGNKDLMDKLQELDRPSKRTRRR